MIDLINIADYLIDEAIADISYDHIYDALLIEGVEDGDEANWLANQVIGLLDRVRIAFEEDE